jgi:hypothetical protein
LGAHQTWINFLIAIATFAGLYLGSPGFHDFQALLAMHTLLGPLPEVSGTGGRWRR